MKSPTRSARKPAVLVAAVMLAAAVLAACGGNNPTNNSDAGNGGNGQTDAVDAFIALVKTQVGLTDETVTEPTSIDNVTAAGNEDKEPVAVP